MTVFSKGKDLISFRDLNREEVLKVISSTQRLKKEPAPKLLEGCILASCFYEPSTRTRLSFEAAMLRLGGKVIGFSDETVTSSMKGESLTDTIKVISGYADIITLRHPKEGAARAAAESSFIPIINAGDGSNQHPTQTLLDLYTIFECQKKLDGLKIALVGDLKYGRTVHSLALAACLFDIRLFLISPDALSLPDEICSEMRKKGVRFSFHSRIEEVLDKIDILYFTRLQKERFEEEDFKKIQKVYSLREDMLGNVKANFRILHPLPRVDEIPKGIDKTPYALYFEQAQNGLYVRQTLLSLMLNKWK